ncbi:MAG: tryptophan--tRNA ligase [Minisyncoccia bacterium]|jgi:tryptophanyl-tRNA synthetase
MKPILVSGIQPTGKLHIGNYLGMLKNAVHLQNSGKYQCYFFVADLHSLTEDFNPKDKPAQIKNVVLDMLAAGIDPKKSIIFIQSAVPAHSELAWILNTITPFGELSRMTQFKDKSEHASENINLGLFDYPVLMAADIILYDAKFVPVGDDQLQHLEFTRTIARKFNNKYGETFIEPQPILTRASRIMSLDEPKKKMSKSRPAGCLFIDDSPDTIRKKIMSAVTDSRSEVKADIEGKEGIGNLILLYSALSGETSAKIEKKYAGKGYGQFKRDLAEVAVKTLTPFQKKKEELSKNTTLINKSVAAGNKEANTVASKKLLEVKKKIGLYK